MAQKKKEFKYDQHIHGSSTVRWKYEYESYIMDGNRNLTLNFKINSFTNNLVMFVDIKSYRIINSTFQILAISNLKY